MLTPFKEWSKAHWDIFPLIALMIGTFLLRTLPQLDKIFVNGAVWFRGVDPWYHMRLVDYMVAHYPLPLLKDVYQAYPWGAPVGFYPVLSWLVATTGKTGLDYEVIGAFLPPVFGALLLIPVYLLGKELIGKWSGLLVCTLIMMLPNEVFHRSMLGFVDQHIIETFLATWILLFLIWAKRRGKLRYSIWAGVCLGLFIFNWQGAAFLVAILALWFAIEFTVLYVRKQDTSQLCRSVFMTVGVGTLVALPWLMVMAFPYLMKSVSSLPTIAVLSGTLLIIAITYILARYIRSRKAVLAILGGTTAVSIPLINFVILPFLSPGSNIWKMVGPLFWGVGSYISEASPMTAPIAFASWGICFVFMFGGIWFMFKRQMPILFIVWSLIMIAITIGQIRWTYYSGIIVVLLAVLCLHQVAIHAKRRARPAIAVIIACAMILPMVRPAIAMADMPNNITQDWYNALTWMRIATEPPYTALERAANWEEVLPSDAIGHMQGIVIEGDYLWASGNDIILKTTKDSPDFEHPLAVNTTARTTGIIMDEINTITIVGDYVYATCPTFQNPPHRCVVKWFDKNTLEFVGEIELKWEGEMSAQEGAVLHGGYWWVGYYDNAVVSRYDKDFNYIDSLPLVRPQTQGLCWVGEELWVSRLYGLDRYVWDGTVLAFKDIIPWPEYMQDTYAQGLTYDSETDTLWVAYYTAKGKERNDAIAKYHILDSPRNGGSLYYQANPLTPNYCVLSWWDYGHWIIRIAQRPVIASPTIQFRGEVSKFLTAQTVEEANGIITGMNVRYIVVDKDMISGKWYAMVIHAELDVRNMEALLPQSMAMRLWLGQAPGYQTVYANDTVMIVEKL